MKLMNPKWSGTLCEEKKARPKCEVGRGCSPLRIELGGGPRAQETTQVTAVHSRLCEGVPGQRLRANLLCFPLTFNRNKRDEHTPCKIRWSVFPVFSA